MRITTDNSYGVHVDEIDDISERVNKEIDFLSSEHIIRMIRYIIIVLFVDLQYYI